MARQRRAYDSRCSICSSPARRALVAQELAAGKRPADILRQHGDELAVSASSLYRHTSAHTTDAPALGVDYLPDGETTTGDLLAALVSDWKSFGAQRAAALARGHDAAATAAGRARIDAAVTLTKHLGLDDVALAESYDELSRASTVTLRAIRNAPEVALLLESAARELGETDLAESFAILHSRALEFRERGGI